jgi:hypothetical protein
MSVGHEIGVIGRQNSVARRAPLTITAVEEFAVGMAQRYVPQTLMASQADLAVACEPPAEVNYYQAAPHVSISPALTFPTASFFSEATRDLGAAVQRVPRYGEREARALFERLFSRHARIASFLSFHSPEARKIPPPELPSLQSGDSAAGARPVERVLPEVKIEKASQDAPQESHPPSHEFSDKDRGSRPLLAAESKPVVLAAPEVRRVAEQVMREINHRVTAQRERLGRR